MPPLLFRFYKRDYWRMLLRPATWSEAASSLHRAHKDRRARQHILQLIFMVLIPALCIGWLIWLTDTRTRIALPLLLVLPILFLLRRSIKHNAAQLRVPASAEQVTAADPSAHPDTHVLTWNQQQGLHLYFSQLALLCAVMVGRAGSERYLKDNPVPACTEINSRRLHLELLKATGIWDRLTPSDREALMMPDGNWDRDMIQRAALAMEPLRLLRWVLRIDFYLPVVGQQLHGSFRLANDLVRRPQKMLAGNRLADLATVAVGRDAAKSFFHRCLAESISRGYFNPEDDAATQWGKQLAQSLHGRQHQDLVLGKKLVSESTREELFLATSLAHRRSDFLTWIMSLLNTGHIPEGNFPKVFGPNVFGH